MSTCTAAGQFKGQFKGSMEERSWNVQNASTHISNSVLVDVAVFEICHTTRNADATALKTRERNFIWAMDESSRNAQKAF